MSRSVGSTSGASSDSVDNIASIPCTEAKPDEIERKHVVDAMWEQMNRGVSLKTPKIFTAKSSSNRGAEKKSSHSWMNHLGMDPKKMSTVMKGKSPKQSSLSQNDNVDETIAMAVPGRVIEGSDIEVKKVDSTDAVSEEMVRGGSHSGVDAILERIKKKPKVSVLEKTKMDWGGYKEENKGVEDELECYKKSSNQYLEKQSFLQRSDYREFERERDARLALRKLEGKSSNKNL